MAANNQSMPQPKLTIDSSSKFYLAVAMRRDDAASLAFVRTLFLKQDKSGAYSMKTYQETHTFNKMDDANMFYQTLSDIVQCNLQSGFGSMVVDYCEGAIREFKQVTR